MMVSSMRSMFHLLAPAVLSFAVVGVSGAPPPFYELHPNYNQNKCLDVRAAVFENGTPVQIYDCNGTPAQRWVIADSGPTKIQLYGTQFCLDAGSHPANGVGMKIWQCYDNLPAQAWDYSKTYALSVGGTGQCLDLTNGNTNNGNQVQTWQCSAGNKNQIWIKRLPFPKPGEFCCPPIGPKGAPLQQQQTGPFTIWCNYSTGTCPYDPLLGTGTGANGCPLHAPENPHPPTCPI